MKLVNLSLVMAAAIMAACSGADGANGQDGAGGKSGANGKDGKDGAESVSLVTPNRGVLDRELEVSIGGSGTTFAAGAKPDFGEGVEVVQVTTSTTALITAKLKIAPDAKVGPRSVKIGTLDAADAFTVVPAIDVVGETGPAKVSQGGFVQFAIQNNDSKAFDPQTFGVVSKSLVDLGSQANGPKDAVGFLLAAPLAKAGMTQVVGQNLGPDGKPKVTFLSAPDALEVTARAPQAFTIGQAAEQTFTGGLETKLFKLTTPAPSFVDYHVEVASDGGSVPIAFVFGQNGQADDQIGRVLPPQNPFTGQFMPAPYDLHVALPVANGKSTVDQYVVLADLSGEKDVKATITATRINATATMESTSAHGPSSPQVLGDISATAAQLVSAELGDRTEVDVYAIPVGKDDTIQLTALGDADLEVILTKDPNVLEDPEEAPDPQVLGAFYPFGKMASQAVVTKPGATTLYAVVRTDSQGSVPTGKYTLGARKLP